MNQITNIKQTMSSREIADLLDKSHDNILKSIRKMEASWMLAGGVKFNETSYTDQWNRSQPQFELNKTECLYVATKFNDEARARLIMRWEDLEKSTTQPQSEDLVLANAFQILNNRVLAQQKEIAKMTPKADYVDKITSSSSYFTTTHVGAPFGLSAIALHKFLIDRGVIRRMSDGEHVMLSKYMNKGYEYYKPVVIHAKDMTKRQLCWTELGRAFIHNLIDPFKRVQSVNNQIQNSHA